MHQITLCSAFPHPQESSVFVSAQFDYLYHAIWTLQIPNTFSYEINNSWSHRAEAH